jgi:hypothetical protein
MSMDKLVRAAQQKGPVCVGLDTQLSFFYGLSQAKGLVGRRKVLRVQPFDHRRRGGRGGLL